MDVALGNRQIRENRTNRADVVDPFSHRGADVCENDGGNIAVNPNRFLQVIAVNFAIRERLDHDVLHLQDSKNLGDTVVGVLAVVADSVRVEFSRQIEPIHVPFGSSIGDIAPIAVFRGVTELGKPVNHFAFEPVRVEAIGPVFKGIPDIVDRKVEESIELVEIEISGAGITNEMLAPLGEFLEQTIEPRRLVWRKLIGHRVGDLWGC